MEGLAKLGLDLKGIVFYIVNFGVVLWVIGKFAFKPLIAWVDKRRNEIDSNLKAASEIQTKLQAEMAEREADHKRNIEKLREEFEQSDKQAKEQARALIASAEAERQRILANAKTEAESLKSQFQEGIEKELLAKVTKVVTASLRSGVTPETAAIIVANTWRDTV